MALFYALVCWVCIYLCMHLCTYTYVRMHAFTCNIHGTIIRSDLLGMYVFMYVSMYIHVCMHVHIYIHVCSYGETQY